MRNRRPVVVALVILATSVSFVGLALATGGPSTPTSAPGKEKGSDNRTAYTSKRMRHVASPQRNPETVLATILQTYGGSRVRAASVEPRAGGVSLHFVVSAPGLEGGGANRAQWESDLVEGAVADMLADGPNRVVTSQIDVRLPDGSTLDDIGGGMGDILPGQQFSTASDSEIRSDITAKLSAAGLTPDSLEILRALQPAPAVIATTTNPTRAAESANDTVRSLFGQNPPVYEGYYFEIRDANGKPILLQSASFRSGSGRLWVSPSVERVSSLNHG